MMHTQHNSHTCRVHNTHSFWQVYRHDEDKWFYLRGWFLYTISKMENCVIECVNAYINDSTLISCMPGSRRKKKVWRYWKRDILKGIDQSQVWFCNKLLVKFFLCAPVLLMCRSNNNQETHVIEGCLELHEW